LKNVLFEQKKVKLWNKWHFVENKTELRNHILKMPEITLLHKYMKLISRGIFFSCARIGKPVSFKG
jgi:hypothetical protein